MSTLITIVAVLLALWALSCLVAFARDVYDNHRSRR